MRANLISKKNWAVLELIFAANFWGFGFIATIWALSSMGPLWLTSTRFIISTALLLPVLYLQRELRKEYTWNNFFIAFFPGIFLSATLILQTIGLQYTTATKSGFITCLYVIFVPILETIFFRKKIRLQQYFYIAFAIVGMILITDIHTIESITQINYGDFLTLLCAVVAALHIISVGRASNKLNSPMVFNTFQSFWSALLPLLLAFFTEKFYFTYSFKATIGFISLIFGSTILAFMLQVKAQKHIDATTASMLFLLESPFAAVYAYYCLSEKINFLQWLGAIIILISAIGCSRSYATKE